MKIIMPYNAYIQNYINRLHVVIRKHYILCANKCNNFETHKINPLLPPFVNPMTVQKK